MLLVHKHCVAVNRALRVQAVTLNLQSGIAQIICAGGQNPALMRVESTSGWCDIAPEAPLGLDEGRFFHSRQLRLKRGDLLVLYMEGGDGSFSQQNLREVLNRCRQSQDHLDAQKVLGGIEQALAEQENKPAYAAVALRFLKPERHEQACTVTAVPDCYPEVLDYLKKSMQERGIPRRAMAFLAVAAEELYTLCCRAAAEGSQITVLCGVGEDGGSATLRIEGDFHGVDPLDPENSTDAGAIEFIHAQSDYQSFQHENGIDAVTIVFFPEVSP